MRLSIKLIKIHLSDRIQIQQKKNHSTLNTENAEGEDGALVEWDNTDDEAQHIFVYILTSYVRDIYHLRQLIFEFGAFRRLQRSFTH